MNREEYNKCIDDWYGVVCGDPDQIYSDYVSCILQWQDEGIINLEYLLDKFITRDDVISHICKDLKTKGYIERLVWIKNLDLSGEYYVINEDNTLHSISMADIVKLDKKIVARLQANVYDYE